MKILTGDIEPTKGYVNRPRKSACSARISSRLTPSASSTRSSWATRHFGKPCEERDKFYANPEELTDEDGMRLGELEGIVGEQGGYTAEADAAVLLEGLDIDDSLHERQMAELQGGQKVRVLLAQALFGNPTVCSSMSPPTTWTSIPSTGSKISVANITAC